MHDHFEVMDLPRRPWLDPEELKERFHRLSATLHPDASGSDDAFATLNAAYATLRDPVSRLRHLLELEYPDELGAARQHIPPKLAEKFMAIATYQREVETFVRQQAAAETPLARALLAQERFAQKRDLEREVAGLESEREGILRQIQAEDVHWEERTDGAGTRLSALHQALAFYSRWIDQLREAFLQLES